MTKLYVSTIVPGANLELYQRFGNEVDLYIMPKNEDGWKFAVTFYDHNQIIALFDDVALAALWCRAVEAGFICKNRHLILDAREPFQPNASFAERIVRISKSDACYLNSIFLVKNSKVYRRSLTVVDLYEQERDFADKSGDPAIARAMAIGWAMGFREAAFKEDERF